MNQRRSEHTPTSWDEIVQQLDNQGKSQTAIKILRTGYRSTRQILAFAGALLSDAVPGSALRDGPEPAILKVREASIVRHAVVAAVDMLRRLTGRIAVITLDPIAVQDMCRLLRLQMSGARHLWREEGRDGLIVVCNPDDARGLEFDGVVVVEPGDFPPNLDQSGLLYTSLTRSTNELMLLHSRPLPKELRSRRGPR